MFAPFIFGIIVIFFLMLIGLPSGIAFLVTIFAWFLIAYND